MCKIGHETKLSSTVRALAGVTVSVGACGEDQDTHDAIVTMRPFEYCGAEYRDPRPVPRQPRVFEFVRKRMSDGAEKVVQIEV